MILVPMTVNVNWVVQEKQISAWNEKKFVYYRSCPICTAPWEEAFASVRDNCASRAPQQPGVLLRENNWPRQETYKCSTLSRLTWLLESKLNRSDALLKPGQLQSGTPSNTRMTTVSWSIKQVGLVCHSFVRVTYFDADVDKFEFFFHRDCVRSCAMAPIWPQKPTIAKDRIGII